MEKTAVLIVEDEKELGEILRDYLEIEGFEVYLSFDGEKGLAVFENVNPKIVLLDIMLPKIDGITLCKSIRKKSNVPIIMVSAKNGEMDKVLALEIGADDYVTKPFSPIELVARVKANLRRYEDGLNINNHLIKNQLSIGDLTLNKDSYSAYVNDKEITLTTKEFEVLYFLAENVNKVFSKNQIYDKVWGLNEYGDISSVTVYIKRLREKLAEYDLDYIKTIWGVGYKLSV